MLYIYNLYLCFSHAAWDPGPARLGKHFWELDMCFHGALDLGPACLGKPYRSKLILVMLIICLLFTAVH